ncbi:TatD family hydrolase [Nanoarchaeota archaeon]
MLVDIHIHLDYHSYDKDRDKIIENAEKAGVKVIITAGIHPSSNRKALEYTNKYKIVKCSLGIYPPKQLQREIENSEDKTEHDPNFDTDKELEWIEQQIIEDKKQEKQNQKILAIGEVGLDYSDVDEKEKLEQKELFIKQLKLAKKYGLPVVIHSRKAEADVLDILENEKQEKVCLHYFCGKKSLIKKAADLKYYFSIPTVIVRAQNFQLMVEKVNINQLLTETDGPFGSPFRGERNLPENVTETIKKIAEIKEFEEEEVKQNIFLNYQRLFS